MAAARLQFSSPGAAAGPAEARRLLRWWQEYRESLGGLDVAADQSMPFATRVDYLQLGAVGLGRSAGSITEFERRASHAARDGIDMFNLVVNRGPAVTHKRTPRHALPLSPGSGVLFDFSETGTHVCPGGHRVLALMIPRRRLRAALPHAEDIAATVLPGDNEALRLLGHYADRLLDDEALSDPAVLAHAGETLVDLVALAFGTDRDRGEIARQRGLRAARLAAVLQRIRLDHADPDLTPDAVAGKLGISTRYLHDLLHETGASFAERVQEQRLAHALSLLCGAAGARRKISDAAYAAGFGDVSHFNRLFRRLYGMSPSAARGRADFLAG